MPSSASRVRKRHSAPRVPCRRILHARPDGPIGWDWISPPGAGQLVDREVSGVDIAAPISASIRLVTRWTLSRSCNHRPVGGVAFGHVLGLGVVDEALGQARRQHQLAVGFARSRPNPACALPRPSPMARRSCPLAVRADPCEGRDRRRRDAPRASLRRRGLGCGSPRIPPVTTRPAKGCGLARKG